MNIKITETQQLTTLTVSDARGIKWTEDLVGNAGAIAGPNEDGEDKFKWSEEDDAYLCSQSTYDWWSTYISDYYKTESEIKALSEKIGLEDWLIWEAVGEAQGPDYARHRMQAIRTLTWFEHEYVNT